MGHLKVSRHKYFKTFAKLLSRRIVLLYFASKGKRYPSVAKYRNTWVTTVTSLAFDDFIVSLTSEQFSLF